MDIMLNQRITHFYFGSSKRREPLARTSVRNIGGLECRMNCTERSDGKLNCPFYLRQTVYLSQETGKFIWYSQYEQECSAAGIAPNTKTYGFHELKEAHSQLKPTDDNSYFWLLLEIIHAFNDEYHYDPEQRIEIPEEDFKFFVECVVEIMKVGEKRMPASLKAELYREAGMFAKCFAFDTANCRSCDEKEIIDEVHIRAIRGETAPFIIEHIEYFKHNLRLEKRFPCPLSHC